MTLHGNGIEIHYDLVGPESADVVTLSHALMADLRMWDPQMEALSSFRVLRYDIRGHGQSEATDGDYDFALLADDIRALLDKLKIESTHFVGCSIGGMIGLELATTTPERLASLTLCGTRGQCNEDLASDRQARIDLAQSAGMAALVDSTIASWFSPAFRKKSGDVVDKSAEMIRSTSVAGVVGCTRAIQSQNHSGKLAQVKLPCLVTVGEADRSTPMTEAFDLHVGIDGSDMVVFPKNLHLPTIESAEQFNEVLVAFLENYS